MARIPRPRRGGTPTDPPAPIPVVPCTGAQLEAFSEPTPTPSPSRGRRRASEAGKRPGEDEFLAKTDPASAPKRRSGGFGEARIQRAAAELDEVIASGEWSRSRPIHFVALYARMHKHVYQVDAVWTAEDRRRFAMMVGTTVRRYFGADYGKFADYMRWVWKREMKTEKWRRDTGNAGRVIGWAFQCSTRLINEYVVNVAARGRD